MVVTFVSNNVVAESSCRRLPASRLQREVFAASRYCNQEAPPRHSTRTRSKDLVKDVHPWCEVRLDLTPDGAFLRHLMVIQTRTFIVYTYVYTYIYIYIYIYILHAYTYIYIYIYIFIYVRHVAWWSAFLPCAASGRAASRDLRPVFVAPSCVAGQVVGPRKAREHCLPLSGSWPSVVYRL